MIKYSTSKIKTFESCKLKYKLHYLDEIRLEQPVTSDTQFGSMFHEMAEFYTGDNLKEILTIQRKYEVNDTYKKYIVPTLKHFFEFWNKWGKYEHLTEESYELKTDDYWVTGIIDRIIQTRPDISLVVDYKTAFRPSDRHTFQMMMYNLIISKKLNIEPKNVRCMVYYPRPHVEQKFMFSNDQINDFEQSLIKQINTIESNEDWTPCAGYHCKWCAYKKTMCPIKGVA